MGTREEKDSSFRLNEGNLFDYQVFHEDPYIHFREQFMLRRALCSAAHPLMKFTSHVIESWRLRRLKSSQ